jgi:hypothetical protein
VGGIALYWFFSLGQLGREISRSWGDAMSWINRNPEEAALYVALVGIFIWAIWRFGRN